MSKKVTDTTAITQIDASRVDLPDETSEWEVEGSGRARKMLVGLGIASVGFLALLGLSVIVVGGFGTAFAFLTLQGVEATVGVSAGVGDAGGAGVEMAAPSIIQPLGHFVVNLLDPGNTRYVTAQMQVEVDKAATGRAIRNNETQFRDATISIIGNRSYSDLMGLEGKARLREDLTARYNRLLTNGQVHRVYFTKFVIQ